MTDKEWHTVKAAIAIESFKEEDGCFTVMIGFSCKTANGDIKLSDEHKSFQWLTPDQVLLSDIPNTYKEFIKVLFKYRYK